MKNTVQKYCFFPFCANIYRVKGCFDAKNVDFVKSM